MPPAPLVFSTVLPYGGAAVLGVGRTWQARAAREECGNNRPAPPEGVAPFATHLEERAGSL
eukprot:15473-Alexandrium_andersonii.AAC.1